MGFLLLPFFVSVIVATSLQFPIVVCSWFVFGWVVLPYMDIPAVGGFPRIPSTSLVALILLISLAFNRFLKSSIRQPLNPLVTCHVFLFVSVFFIGYMGIWIHGKWESLLVQTLAWQKLISCTSMFFCGLLCCRSRADFNHILRIMPFCFLVWLMYIPFDSYRDFFFKIISSESSYSIGLEYGVLNTNTLGHGACLVAIVSFVFIIARDNLSNQNSHNFYFRVLFIVSTIVTLFTASRQAALALLVGLFLVLFRLRSFIATLIGCFIISLTIIVCIQSWKASTNPFVSRFVDIAKSNEEWTTSSASDRLIEFERALPFLLDRPLFGYGFGGYSLGQEIPDIERRSELNESDILNQLWNEGYPLVGEHNFLLSLYLQIGAVGLIAFLLLFISPYKILIKQNKNLPAADRYIAHYNEIAFFSLGVAIFVLQNISGGLSLGSMSFFLFVTGSLIAALANTKTIFSKNKKNTKVLYAYEN